MLRNDAIYYYCNLSSPYVVDNEGIKYIDYDLDVKVYPGGDIIDLDEDEFNFNTRYLHYSPDIIKIIKRNRDILKGIINAKEEPFNSESVYAWYNLYLSQNPDLDQEKTKVNANNKNLQSMKGTKGYKFKAKSNFKRFKKNKH